MTHEIGDNAQTPPRHNFNKAKKRLLWRLKTSISAVKPPGKVMKEVPFGDAVLLQPPTADLLDNLNKDLKQLGFGQDSRGHGVFFVNSNEFPRGTLKAGFYTPDGAYQDISAQLYRMGLDGEIYDGDDNHVPAVISQDPKFIKALRKALEQWRNFIDKVPSYSVLESYMRNHQCWEGIAAADDEAGTTSSRADHSTQSPGPTEKSCAVDVNIPASTKGGKSDENGERASAQTNVVASATPEPLRGKPKSKGRGRKSDPEERKLAKWIYERRKDIPPLSYEEIASIKSESLSKYIRRFTRCSGSTACTMEERIAEAKRLYDIGRKPLRGERSGEQ